LRQALANVGRFSMTTRTYAPLLSLSIATCSTCDSVWLGDDAFLPLLPTFDDRSPAVGQRSLPSTREAVVDVSHEMCYYLTCLDTQLSRIIRPLLPIPRIAPVSGKRIAPSGCTRPRSARANRRPHAHCSLSRGGGSTPNPQRRVSSGPLARLSCGSTGGVSVNASGSSAL